MRLGLGRERERGDTIIEVIFAVVIFALVATSCLSIMSQGIATGERALEVTLVRQQIKAQAEALRYIHEARVAAPTSEEAATWRTLLTNYKQASASSFGGTDACALPGAAGYKPFILNARTARIWTGELKGEYDGAESLPPYSQVAYDDDNGNPTVVKAAYGIWIEAVPSSLPVAAPFVDFHIRACWPGPGMSTPMTLGTIVRLYEPA
jgi:type II secretory pathway pseudopilin PulG